MQDLQSSLKVSNWTSPYECDWPGVFCDFDFNILSISLANLNFTGTFPTGIFPLFPKLEFLSIINTLLLTSTLSLPSDICASPSLKNLEIYNFTLKSFPPLSQCSNLEILHITYSQLIGPLPDFSTLLNLKVLELNHNNLTGTIPASLGNLPKLEVVRLFNNQLTGSLPVFASQYLEVLDVRENSLEGDDTLFSKPSAIYFGFDGNKLKVPELCIEIPFCVYIK